MRLIDMVEEADRRLVVPPDAPLENLVEMVETVREFPL